MLNTTIQLDRGGAACITDQTEKRSVTRSTPNLCPRTGAGVAHDVSGPRLFGIRQQACIASGRVGPSDDRFVFRPARAAAIALATEHALVEAGHPASVGRAARLRLPLPPSRAYKRKRGRRCRSGDL